MTKRLWNGNKPSRIMSRPIPLFPVSPPFRHGGLVLKRSVVLQASRKITSNSSTCSKQSEPVSIYIYLMNFFLSQLDIFLSWSKPQVKARSHPNVLATQDWLNSLYHVPHTVDENESSLDTPLAYADRLRIRHPGRWFSHPPHIDGASYVTCFMSTA